mgnify:CR=1 FL=1
MLSSLKKESAGNDPDQPHLSTADITEHGRWTWGTNKPPTGSKYGWTSSPFWGVWPESAEHPVIVFIDTTIGAGTTWVTPDDFDIDYEAGTITVTRSVNFETITVKFEVKQPPLHPHP